VTSTSVRSLLEAFPLPPDERRDLLNLNIAKKREITLNLIGIDHEMRDETQQDTAGAMDLLPRWEDDDPLLRPDDLIEGEAVPEILRRDEQAAGTEMFTPQTPGQVPIEDEQGGVTYVT
jgi:hypothetical protein